MLLSPPLIWWADLRRTIDLGLGVALVCIVRYTGPMSKAAETLTLTISFAGEGEHVEQGLTSLDAALEPVFEPVECRRRLGRLAGVIA